MATNAEPTVFVVDDNRAIRESVQALLQAEGIAAETYSSSQAFLDAYNAGRPGCLLLDVRLKGSSGLDLQDELKRRRIELPVIIITAYGNVPTSVRAFKGGAIDFLQKPVLPEKLIESVRRALKIDQRQREAAAERSTLAARIAQLTPREREVMNLLVAGKPSKEIAWELRISVRTVEGHRREILRKMNVTSATELAHTVLLAGVDT